MFFDSKSIHNFTLLFFDDFQWIKRYFRRYEVYFIPHEKLFLYPIENYYDKKILDVPKF